MKTGQRVAVSFANRTTVGYVVKCGVPEPSFSTKTITKSIDPHSYLTQADVSTACEISRKYLAPPGKVFDLFFPPGKLIKSERFVIPLDESVELKGPTTLSKAQERLGKRRVDELRKKELVKVVYSYSTTRPRTQVMKKVRLVSSLKTIRDINLSEPAHRVINCLLATDEVALSELMKVADLKSRSPIETLLKNGIIEIFDTPCDEDSQWVVKFVEKLTDDQQKIIRDIATSNERDHLIYGVTGSGKTEIYFSLMESCLNKGKQALLLVPEVSLTPQLLARVRGYFPGREVRQYHSYLKQSQRQRVWLDAVEGNIDILVGTRSAVWVPIKNLGIIVVDEEHDSSFFQQVSPHYDALEVARVKGRNLRIPVIAGSATPRVDTFHSAISISSPLLHRLTSRPMRSEVSVEIVDMRENEGFTIISDKAVSLIEQTVSRGGQCFVFAQRKGFSNYVVCSNCGDVKKCTDCDVGMTFHRVSGVLKCHYCGRVSTPPSKCERCGSKSLVARGFGTERVEHELRKVLPAASIMRMDRETVTNPEEYENALRLIESQKVQIVVGTKMISKGLDFPRVDLVVVIDADRLINMPTYNAAESAFQTLFQVAGRGSRGESGHTVIQTFNPENRVIGALQRSDYELFFSSEIIIREELNYPPFANMADIVIERPSKSDAAEKALAIANSLEESLSERAEILGPVEPLISKIRNLYRQRIIVKFSSDEVTSLIQQALKPHLSYSDVSINGTGGVL